VESRIPLCPHCAQQLVPNLNFYCPVCKKRLPDGGFQCDTHQTLPLRAIACLFDWQNPLMQKLILNFKYHNLVPLKNVFQIYMKTIFEQQLNFLAEQRYTIIPIPLSAQKLRQRGFNQAEIIIPPAISATLPIMANNLLRIKNNLPQALTRSALERAQNMSGAFAINSASAIAKKNFILIDDVYTTGATLNEAAKVLKNNGAKNIIGITLAGQIY